MSKTILFRVITTIMATALIFGSFAVLYRETVSALTDTEWLNTIGYPFANGQTWCVVQGYNSGWTHGGSYPNERYAFDLVKNNDNNISRGAEVRAAADGYALAWDYGSDGMFLRVYKDYGVYGGYNIVYAHLDRDGLNPKINTSQRIYKGEVLGRVHDDNPVGGYYHLHFDIEIGQTTPVQLVHGVWNYPANGSVNQYNGACITSRTEPLDYNNDGTPDVWGIKMQNTTLNKTELHIINGKDPSQWAKQVETALGETNSNYSFDAGDYNNDGTSDLWVIKRANTGSGKTEIHILNGKNLGQWLFHSATALAPAGNNFVFAVADYNNDRTPDLYAIKTTNTGTNKTEVHILNGKNPQQWLLNTGTALGKTNRDFSFAVKDFNRDSKPDVWAIKRANGTSGKTEVYILNGSNLNSWLLQTSTILEPTGGANWDFAAADYNQDSYTDLMVIKKANTTSGKTELHVLNGRNNLQSWLKNTATILGATSSNWEFAGSERARNLYR